MISLMPIDELPEELLPASSKDAFLETLEQRQLLLKVTHLIPNLPEKQQLVLALHYQDDLSYREIAQVLDLTAGRISQLHTQAMLQIRAWLKVDQNLPKSLPPTTIETPPSGE
jgi:RNA polymerase sigma factor for flagellar operon FliA